MLQGAHGHKHVVRGHNTIVEIDSRITVSARHVGVRTQVEYNVVPGHCRAKCTEIKKIYLHESISGPSQVIFIHLRLPREGLSQTVRSWPVSSR